jgi:NADH dehydrogenase [ubiquinone] 1 alpha subcomplex assembly factor 7
VEASSHLREAQRKLLCGDTPFQKNDRGVESRSKYPNKHRIVWVEDSIDVPTTADGQSPFIIAHEFFDALPIHVFQSTPSETQSSGLITSTTPTRTSSRTSKGNKWRELLVTPTSPFSSASPPGSKPAGSSAPEFELVLSNHSTAVDQLLTSLSPRYSALLPTTGAVVEISPESLSLVAEMAKRIGADQKPKQAPSGAALIIDYGPRNTIPTNSLRGIRDHTLVSPFHSPGLVDLSASVDFTGLAEYALEASPRIECHGPVPQAWFLRAMGIVQRAEMLVKKAGGDEDAVRRIEGAWKRLVDVGPRGMGELYQVLGIVPLGRSEEVGGVVGFGGDVKG